MVKDNSELPDPWQLLALIFVPGPQTERRKFMRRYETVFISHPDLSDEDIEKLTQRAVDIIRQYPSEVFQVQQWGRKKLAYDIARQSRGSYTFLDYAAVPDVVKELERVLRLDDKVMKYLTVVTEERVDLEAVRKALAEGKVAGTHYGEEEVSEAVIQAEAAPVTEGPPMGPEQANDSEVPTET